LYSKTTFPDYCLKQNFNCILFVLWFYLALQVNSAGLGEIERGKSAKVYFARLIRIHFCAADGNFFAQAAYLGG